MSEHEMRCSWEGRSGARWLCVSTFVSGVYSNTWVHHMQAHTCSYEVFHCSLALFHLLVILKSFGVFCLVLLVSFDIMKQTHLVSGYLRPHMGYAHSSNMGTAVDQFFTARIQSSYISSYLCGCVFVPCFFMSASLALELWTLLSSVMCIQRAPGKRRESKKRASTQTPSG